MEKKLTSRRQRWLIPAMSICCFFLLVRLLAAAQFTYGPVTILFPKGSAEITAPCLEKIKALAVTIQGKNIREIRLEGFSDSSKVSKENPFADNKSLTIARAENVSKALQSESGLDAQLFNAIGNGNSSEVATNTTEEGMAMNRRVEIRVIVEDQVPSPSTSLAAPAQIILPRISQQAAERITLNLRAVDIAEAFEMLSKQKRVNIVLEKDVVGAVSVNLYEVTLDEAITEIAAAAGYEAQINELGYRIRLIDPLQQAERSMVETEMRTYAIQYANPEKVEALLAKHLSNKGKATALLGRNLVVIEDVPSIFDKIEVLLKKIDLEPKQILIEAKILEITLDETESFGLNWWQIFSSGDNRLDGSDTGNGKVGVRGLSQSDTGFIFNLINDNVNITLDALNKKGKVKTLSTPKILTIENEESSVIIGDRKGYNVTTTIDQVTTTSIEFLESGVILKVTPSVDSQNRILLKIHPEVSSGSVTGGIPSQTTTEVTTSLLSENGQTSFIGGLLKKKSDFTKEGVPVLGEIPFLGRVFSATKDIQENTETVILITPYIVTKDNEVIFTKEISKVDRADTDIQKEHAEKIEVVK